MKIRKIIKKILPRSFKSKISDGYKIIENPNLDKLRKKYKSTWQNNSIPYKQLKLTKQELIDFNKIAPMKSLVGLMKKIKISKAKVLEIGCSTGYYSEVFKKAGLKVKYTGCDYSEAFIKLAKKRHPKIKFKVSNAIKLDYRNKQFDIVISGCCILHIIDYKKAISEAARVANNFVIFHRTPVIHLKKTTFTKKIGYDLEMLEILFNEEELMDLFYKNGLNIQSVNVYTKFAVKELGELVFMKSYLCRKI